MTGGRIILSARSIVKEYIVGAITLEVLKGLDIDLFEGQIVAIIGESGAGKSTLLNILGMLDRPTSGSLDMNGENLMGKSDAELAVYRNRFVGFIFQFHHLLPEFNALENVLMPALISGSNGPDTEKRAVGLLEKVGLGGRLDHRPGELSGGELQRVAVARALMNEPSVIFADEPSGNLDRQNSEMLHSLIWGLARENNSSFVVVTHDLGLARRADRIMELRDGLLREINGESIGAEFTVP
ncbi:MAG: ABC transporter ATP-binding protein [Candidatus Latescibacteria bacterium]|nr:ABC transporter ATP-binding protein [Candidatus Latescibacterota bacterium]